MPEMRCEEGRVAEGTLRRKKMKLGSTRCSEVKITIKRMIFMLFGKPVE